MATSITLEKGKIYKLKTSSTLFKRDYMIFSPKRTLHLSNIYHLFEETFFIIDLEGGFSIDNEIGIWFSDEVVPMEVCDWFEVGQVLKNTKYKFNLRTKELINTIQNEEELEEI